MNFYESIATNYDHIFPLKQPQFNFVSSEFSSAINTILDVGCSTGSLAIKLAENDQNVFGIDLDQKMIHLAHEKAKNLNNLISFDPHNMTELQQHYPNNNFDIITCFGNTIVHLLSDKEILNLFIQIKSLLKENGKFLFQILNYDHIVKNKITKLPLIENQHIKFDRIYNFTNSQIIDFTTTLLIKETNQTIKNTTPLYAIQLDNLKKLLSKANFKKIELFENFTKTPFNKKTSLRTIAICQ
jgi:glycine/sarcosine N-methyltransferase